MLEISKIKEGLQARESISESTIQEYIDHLNDGGSFPPVVVFFDSKDYWLADGWHRLIAHKRIRCLTIHEDVHIGGRRDALRYALGANTHGLQRSNADKRNAVNIALADDEWSKLSNKELAKLCAVSNTFIANIKEGGKRLPPASTSTGVATVATKPPKAATGENENATTATEATHGEEVAGDEQPALPPEAPEAEPEYTELDAAHDLISDLQDMVAVGFMNGTPDDRATANMLIKELKGEVKRLSAEVQILTAARDSWQNQAAELKNQVVRQGRQLTKLTGIKQ